MEKILQGERDWSHAPKKSDINSEIFLRLVWNMSTSEKKKVAT